MFVISWARVDKNQNLENELVQIELNLSFFIFHFSARKDRRRFKRTFSHLLSLANRLNLQIKRVWFALVDG